ncbi:MAG: ATP-grasp domain-containing protein [Alphaproteobacteria bacterium]|nr:ATP-grasp domain-containing protein [Alphaproteobacteria bacterium]
MNTLLFTGGGGAGNEAIFRLLGERYDLHFADADPAAIDPAIPAERRHAIPLAAAPSFGETLVALCQRLGVDLLVPGVDEELPHLAAREDVPVLLPEPAYVSVMLDKLESVRALAAKGLDAPQTVAAGERWSAFPCIAKPRDGRGSREVRVLDDASQVAAYLKLTGYAAESVVLQELLTGQEYTVLMAADQRARLHAVVPVKVEVKRGITLRAEIVDNGAVVETCRRIHAALPARGCYNIQLVHDKAGRVIPFEINPRVSTTFCLGLAAGVDPIAVYLQNEPPATMATGQAGTTLRRFWANHIQSEKFQS